MVALVCLGVWLALCPLGWGGSPDTPPPRLKVAATIFPLYDLVRNVAGPDVEVVLLVPPGASPHTFAAKPGTIRALTGSAAIFAIGHAMDDWVTRLAQGADVEHTIVVDTNVALHAWEHPSPKSRSKSDHRDHHHGRLDPHYWLAIPNAIHMVQNIADTLGQLDPVAREDYQQRAAVYQAQLHAVHDEICQLFNSLLRRDIATFHPAFAYFANAYTLRIIATFEPSPGQEPTPRHVVDFLRQLQRHDLNVLFVEPQLPQSLLSSLAHDAGIVLKELDPLGGGVRRESYLAMMRFNAAQIAASLRQ